jgi:copper transport protein
LAAALLLVVLAIGSADAVDAHAVLLRATPSSSQTLNQAPDQVELLFSEPLDPVFSHVQVQDASGQIVDVGDSHVDPEDDRLLVATVRPGLAAGVYTVVWRSLSAIDVHPDEGQYPLFVGVPVSRQTSQVATLDTTATPATTVSRWWFYLAASLFGGVLATWKLVLEPVLHDSADGKRASVGRRAQRIVVLGGVLLVVGTLFAAVAQAASAASVPLDQAVGQPLADLLLRGRFASIWWPRLGLEIASLALIAFGGIDGLASECALATLPAVLLTSALTSHGAALPNGAAAGIVVDWLHIVGATTWVGGLIALAVCLPLMRANRSSSPLDTRLLARFARLALAASLVVMLSGVIQGTYEVGSWSALATTLYGNLLLVKVGLLTAMLALAGLNEWQARSTSISGGADLGRVQGFGRGLRAELALGVVVLAVAALLSGTPPQPGG